MFTSFREKSLKSVFRGFSSHFVDFTYHRLITEYIPDKERNTVHDLLHDLWEPQVFTVKWQNCFYIVKFFLSIDLIESETSLISNASLFVAHFMYKDKLKCFI